MDGASSRGDSFNFSGYRLFLNDVFWTPAIGLLPFNLYKAGRQAGACMILLGNQGWLAREEGPKGLSQELTDIKSYSSRLWSVPTSIASFKSFLRKNNKHGSSSI